MANSHVVVYAESIRGPAWTSRRLTVVPQFDYYLPFFDLSGEKGISLKHLKLIGKGW